MSPSDQPAYRLRRLDSGVLCTYRMGVNSCISPLFRKGALRFPPVDFGEAQSRMAEAEEPVRTAEAPSIQREGNACPEGWLVGFSSPWVSYHLGDPREPKRRLGVL